MTDYRAVMDQVLKGWSVRQICSSSRCSHTTVQKARDALVEHNITTREQLRGVADHELVDWFVDGRSHAQGDFVPIDFDAVAKARTGRNKVTLQGAVGPLHRTVCGHRPAVLQLRAVSPTCGSTRRCSRADRQNHPCPRPYDAGGLGRHEDAAV